MAVEREEVLGLIRRVAERGGTLRIAYNADLDSASAAAIAFSAARRMGARAVARPYEVVLDLSRASREVMEDDALLAIGLLVKGEPSAHGVRDAILIEPSDYPAMRERLASPALGSSALSALEVMGDGSQVQAVRALVGYYATRCYLSDRACGEAAARASRLGDRFQQLPDSPMIALRRLAPLDAAISLTPYPSMAYMLGDRPTVAEGLREAGVCADSCPTLEELEGKRESAEALRSYLSRALPKELYPRLIQRRILLRDDAGLLSDMSDLSLLEESLMFREGPQSSLVDSLEFYPRALKRGLESLLEISRSIPRIMSQISRSAQGGGRAILVEELNLPSAASPEVFVKSAAFPMLEGDRILVFRHRSGLGGVYTVGARSSSPVDALLSEAEGMGAHHVTCGPLARIWVPAEEDRRFRSLLT
ncbi:MAG: hypothetical protein RXP91_00415 [Nitrososphaeria archaeon]